MNELDTLYNELRHIDRQLGLLGDMPHMRKAPDYVRATLTEQRDRIMRVAVQLSKLNYDSK